MLEAPELDALAVSLAIPDTLQASLMARLDRLPGAKVVAQIGSVIGREFSHTLLASAADMPDANLTRELNQLAASGLLFQRGVPPDAVYTFKHALVRDVVYASLPKPPRLQLHRNIAEAVRDQLPERAETEPEVVAYHFTQAGLSEAAVEWWSKAGSLALQRSAFVEAIAHLEKALDLSQDLDDSEDQRTSHLRLQISYGNALQSRPRLRCAGDEGRLRTRSRYCTHDPGRAGAILRRIWIVERDVPQRRSARDAGACRRFPSQCRDKARPAGNRSCSPNRRNDVLVRGRIHRCAAASRTCLRSL